MFVHILDANVHNVNGDSAQPSILPLFRSDAQFRILGELFTNPGLELPISELADRVHVSRPTTSREVARLSEAGLVATRPEGNRTLVRARTAGAILADLRALLAKVYGPVAAIRDAFVDLPVEQVRIFGSWAARWRGEPGPPPNDVDVLVVGDAAYEQVWDAAARLSSLVGLEVTPVLRTPAEWAEDDSPFAQQVRARPSVVVIDRTGSGGGT